MDTAFDTTDYRPTKPPGPADCAKTEQETEALFAQLRDQTKGIIKHPYDPYNWTQRASTISELHYPELAVGDAHKAAALCRSHTQVLDETKDSGWRLGHRMGFWMRDPLPRRRHHDFCDEDEYRRQLLRHLLTLQGRANAIESANLYYLPYFEEGRLRRRMYPWMLGRHRSRSDALIAMLNEEFVQNSASGEDGGPFCVVKRDAFGQGDKDVLGVFAARRIGKHEPLLVDETSIWGSNLPRLRREHETLTRRTAVGDTVQLTNDTIDLRWIRDEVGKQAGPVMLNCRLLLASINDGAEHPLDHPLIARLTPTYSEDKIATFVLLNDIAVPNRALQAFGIDIFANQNYDTWVLLTVQARILNNSCGDPSAECLNPLFALFNHSCKPNVEWTAAAEDRRTILIRARRNIEEGEQLLVEYDQFMRDQPLEIRRKRMYRWLDGACPCPRCLAEEAEQKKNGGVVQSEWDDILDKAVFPEDLLKLN